MSAHSRDDTAYQVFHKFFASGYALQKLLLVPKDTPPALIKAYRQAAATLPKREDFLTAARNQVGPYTPVVGEVAAKQLESAMQLSDARRQWVIKNFCCIAPQTRQTGRFSRKHSGQV